VEFKKRTRYYCIVLFLGFGGCSVTAQTLKVLLHIQWEKIMYKVITALILSLIIISCENTNEPIDTSNLLIPEITNLKVSNDNVSFNWINYNTLQVDFEIDRKIEGEDYKAFVKLDYTNYGIADTSLAKGVVAYYRIRAVYKNRTSEYAYSIPVVRYTSALVDSNFQNYYLYEAYKLNNGKFLLIGTKHYEPAMSMIFDPASNQISNLINMPINIEGYSFNLLDNGNVFLAGGRVSDAHYKKCFIYNTQSNIWSAAADLLYLQTGNSSVKMPDGKILISGGFTSNGDITNNCQLYNPVINTWTALASLSSARVGHAIALLPDGKVLVAGGAPLPGYTSNTCEVYDPASNTWLATAPLNEKRSGIVSYLLPNNNVMVLENSGYSRTVEIYNTANGMWSYGGERKNHNNIGASTQLSDGRILIVGNTSYPSNELRVEIYYPDINKWVQSNSIPSSAYIWSVVTSDDKRAYVFGGLDQNSVSVIDLN